MSRFLSSLGFSVLTVILSSVVLVLVVSPPKIDLTAKYVASRDGARAITYEVVGNSKNSNCIIWLHGILSSRYETSALNKDTLDELDAYVVSYDRPGYGESTPLRRRNYGSEMENIEDLANALGIKKFFLAAVSGGGPYALAAAAQIPGRLRGILLLSAAGSPGNSTAPAITEQQQRRNPYLVKALQYPLLVEAAKRFVETYVGGRALYSLWLEDLATGLIARFSEVDKRCVMKQHRNLYLLKLVPESTKQGTATALIQDILLIARPWPFNLTDIPAVLQPAIHIWHGTQDLQVDHSHASAYKKMLPKAHLRIIQDGGHMAYWACDDGLQKQALEQLIGTGLPA